MVTHFQTVYVTMVTQAAQLTPEQVRFKQFQSVYKTHLLVIHLCGKMASLLPSVQMKWFQKLQEETTALHELIAWRTGCRATVFTDSLCFPSWFIIEEIRVCSISRALAGYKILFPRNSRYPSEHYLNINNEWILVLLWHFSYEWLQQYIVPTFPLPQHEAA